MKALPKMAKAARSGQLQRLFELHLEETEAQVERLNECLSLLGSSGRVKPCKGMMGIVEEGQEVMEESKNKDDAVADLALIGAAQRVEHYEIAGYTTVRNLAQQLHHSAIAPGIQSLMCGVEPSSSASLLSRRGQLLCPLAPSRAVGIRWGTDGSKPPCARASRKPRSATSSARREWRRCDRLLSMP